MAYAFRGQKVLDDLANQLLCKNFERTCLPREFMTPAWDVTLMLQGLTTLPFDPMKLSSDKHLTLKMCFFLALALAQGVANYPACHMQSSIPEAGPPALSPPYPVLWPRSNPTLQAVLLDDFTIPYLKDFVGGAREEMLLYSIKVVKVYLSRTAISSCLQQLLCLHREKEETCIL